MKNATRDQEEILKLITTVRTRLSCIEEKKFSHARSPHSSGGSNQGCSKESIQLSLLGCHKIAIYLVDLG